jgi:hypothetical protein
MGQIETQRLAKGNSTEKPSERQNDTPRQRRVDMRVIGQTDKRRDHGRGEQGLLILFPFPV